MLISILFAFPFLFVIGMLAFAPRECTIIGNELRVKTLVFTLKYDLTEMRGAMPVRLWLAAQTLRLFLECEAGKFSCICNGLAKNGPGCISEQEASGFAG